MIASGFAEAISDIDLFGGRDPKVWYKYLVVNRLYVEVKYTHVKWDELSFIEALSIGNTVVQLSMYILPNILFDDLPLGLEVFSKTCDNTVYFR